MSFCITPNRAPTLPAWEASGARCEFGASSAPSVGSGTLVILEGLLDCYLEALISEAALITQLGYMKQSGELIIKVVGNLMRLKKGALVDFRNGWRKGPSRGMPSSSLLALVRICLLFSPPSPPPTSLSLPFTLSSIPT